MINNSIQSSRRIKHRYFLVAIVMIWCISFGIAFVVITFDVSNKANSEIHDYSVSLINRLDNLLSKGEEVINDINQLPITDCSSDSIYQIKLLHFNNYLIQNATKLMPGHYDVCSSMMGLYADPLQAIPADLEFNRIRYWFNQIVNHTNPLKNHMVMEKDGARINMHLQILFDSDLNTKTYLAAQFLSQGRVIATSGPTIDSRSLLNAGTEWRSQLVISSERERFSVLVARNENHIQQAVTAVFTGALGWLALLASVLSLLLYFCIKNHHNSFKFALIDGIERCQLIPHFQPIIDTKSNTCVGAEVLTRWFCHDGSMISPSIFIPAAEQYGLMPKLTRYIIGHTLKEVGTFLSVHPHYYISINLSLDDLENESIYDLLNYEVTRYGLASDQLRIELTERQFINKDSAITALQRYTEAGYRIYVDDFGTGYSSLAYLNDLPIDTLKIDKVFVDSLGFQSVTSSVTKHIIDMANTLNLELIAEGVENEMQSQYLQTLGVTVMQGWLYSKALSASEWILFCQLTNMDRREVKNTHKKSKEIHI